MSPASSNGTDSGLCHRTMQRRWAGALSIWWGRAGREASGLVECDIKYLATAAWIVPISIKQGGLDLLP